MRLPRTGCDGTGVTRLLKAHYGARIIGVNFLGAREWSDAHGFVGHDTH